MRVLGRRSRESGEGTEFVIGDLATGDGVEAAVERAEIIVHCAGSGKGDENKARHLIRAASRAGARHVVYISVVGADKIPVANGVDRVMFGLGGPRVYEVTAPLGNYLRVRRKHRPIVPLWIPGGAARAFRAGANLAPDRAVGHRTWEDFLVAESEFDGAARR